MGLFILLRVGCILNYTDLFFSSLRALKTVFKGRKVTSAEAGLHMSTTGIGLTVSPKLIRMELRVNLLHTKRQRRVNCFIDSIDEYAWFLLLYSPAWFV